MILRITREKVGHRQGPIRKARSRERSGFLLLGSTCTPSFGSLSSATYQGRKTMTQTSRRRLKLLRCAVAVVAILSGIQCASAARIFNFTNQPVDVDGSGGKNNAS